MTVAVVFPGQGSQFADMLDPWLMHPDSAAVIREASDLLSRDLVMACKKPGALQQTDLAQVALYTCALAAWRVLEAEGVQPVAVGGHSLGEFVALVAAGATTFERAFTAVQARADAMRRACEQQPGAMLAVIGLPADAVRAMCVEAAMGDDLVVANENSPEQVVISGTVAAIQRATSIASARGVHVMRLPVAGAFHSPLMSSGLGQVAAAVTRMALTEAHLPIVENSSAEPTTDPRVLEDLLCRHLVSPVRWVATVDALVALGATTFVEAGPGKVLTGMIRRCVPGIEAVSVGSPSEAAALTTRL